MEDNEIDDCPKIQIGKNNQLKELPKKPDWIDCAWAQDYKTSHFPNPYHSWKTYFRFAINAVLGPSNKYKKKTNFIPPKYEVNKISEVKYRIGFVGDIMKMNQYGLGFRRNLRDFLRPADLIVGNLEGIITMQREYIFAQRHNLEILLQLQAIAKPKKWLINVSNNHSGDFGLAEFTFHLNRIHWDGYHVMGRRDIPNYIHDDTLNFVSGTEWSNQEHADFMTRLKRIKTNPNMFNILFPHWTYEYELYPRPESIERAVDLMNDWDLIIGHHPHVPQPITCFKDDLNNVNKLLAYSMGNFCSGMDAENHKYGIIALVDIGPLQSDPKKLAVGNVKWTFAYCYSKEEVSFREGMLRPPKPRIKHVKTVDMIEYFEKKIKDSGNLTKCFDKYDLKK